MRRLPTWIVVTGVSIVAALAAADAIRSPGGSTQLSLEPPRASALQGSLVVAGPDCSVSALSLPALVEEEPPRQPDCGGTVWSADGTVSARCADDTTTVGPTPDGVFFRMRGCRPAWRQDGAVSVIRDGGLFVAGRHRRPQSFLTRHRLTVDLAGRLQESPSYRLQEVAWLGPTSFAAIIAGRRAWQTAVVVFRNRHVERIFPELGQHISTLRVSDRGEFAFARNQLGREFIVLNRFGSDVRVPRVANAQAFAWSPDGAWIALSTRTTTFIARRGAPGVVKQIAVGGVALDWTR